MGFSTLLGNDQLKQNLTASLARGHISHFYLISGPRGAGKHTLARLLASAILCRGTDRPCGVCGPCRKLLDNNHPDFITVEDPEHKTVPVKLVREMREDMFIRPNESEHKIYLFPQELGVEGYNALLKILEEPPAYGVFLFLTDNANKVLPTVRSRCVELKLQPLDSSLLARQLRQEFPQAHREDIDAAILRSGGFLGQARQVMREGQQIPPQTQLFVQSLTKRDALALVQVLAPMEKWKRDDLIPMLESWTALCEGALVARLSGGPAPVLSKTLAQARGSSELMDVIHKLKKAQDYARGNISPGAICGWLAWELR